VVILQEDRFDATASVTVCSMTSALIEDAPLLRIRIEPDAVNGLSRVSDLMVDKLVTVRRGRLGGRIGRLSTDDLVRLERAVFVFLGLA
jgi:mRNA interferase MazF